MSDAPQYPAGWYSDPADPNVQRWWDGQRWTEARSAAPGTTTNAATSTTAATTTTAAPVSQVTEPQLRTDIPTNTAWIWLVVLLPLVSLVTIFFFDWRGYVEDVVAEAVNTSGTVPTWFAFGGAATLVISLVGLVVVAAQIVFAYLDWRTLRERGVEQPFHWAWIFLTLIITNGVYVIGRGVILYRRTRSGLAPIWAWIAVTVVSWIVGIVFAVVLVGDVFAILDREGLLYR